MCLAKALWLPPLDATSDRRATRGNGAGGGYSSVPFSFEQSYESRAARPYKAHVAATMMHHDVRSDSWLAVRLQLPPSWLTGHTHWGYIDNIPSRGSPAAN